MANEKSLLTEKEAQVILAEIKQVQAMSEEEFQACLEAVRTADLPNKETRLDALTQMRAFDLKTVKTTGKGAKSSKAEGEKSEKRGCFMILDPKTSVDADGHILVNGEVRARGTAELIKDNPVPVDLIFVLDDVRLDWICERLGAKLIIETRSAVKAGRIKASDVIKPGFRIPVSVFASKEINKKSAQTILFEGYYTQILKMMAKQPKSNWAMCFDLIVPEEKTQAFVDYFTQVDAIKAQEFKTNLD